ncbi:MAG: inositol phosphorylceramide synthase [Nocardioidaceae bacterium]|nr:inositol phosphorylceramide synthase [Nocardioidaceae bacterium]
MVWRAYGFAVALAAVISAVAVAVAVGYDLPLRDPDDAAGPTYLRLTLVIGAAFLTDVVPRCVRRADTVRQMPAQFRAVVRERWPRRQVTLLAVGLGSWYLTYVAFRNLKSFVPFVNDRLYDAELARLDEALTFGNNPAVLLHDLLGTDVAAHALSAVYIAWIGFVPVSLAAALVWSRNLRLGSWYVTAVAIDWVLGVATYFALPTVGPVYADPGRFEELTHTAAGRLQTSMWQERLDVVADPEATAAVQTIAAFASLHVGILVTACLIAHLAGLSARIRWLLWGFLALTVLSTVYLGWHYLLDAFGGVVLGTAAVMLGALVTGNARALRTRRPGALREEVGVGASR